MLVYIWQTFQYLYPSADANETFGRLNYTQLHSYLFKKQHKSHHVSFLCKSCNFLWLNDPLCACLIIYLWSQTNPAVKNKLIVYHIQFIASGNIGTVRTLINQSQKMDPLKLKFKVLVLLVVTTSGNIYALTEVRKYITIAFWDFI